MTKSRRPGAPNGYGRRDFLRMSGLGVAGAAILGAAGCGDDSSDRAEKVVFMYWGDQNEKKGVEAAVAKFVAANPGLSVDGQHVDYQTYPTKINTLVAAKQTPDVAYLEEGLAMRLAEQGQLANILDHRQRFAELDDLLPGVMHQWAPGKAVAQICVETAVLWYNRDLFTAAGVSPLPISAPQALTWDGFVQIADKLTIDRNGRHPSESGFDPKQVAQWGCNAATWMPMMYPLLRSNGADILDETGTKCALDSDAAVEVIYQQWALMHEHRVAPSPTQFDQLGQGLANLLKTKRVAMAIEGQWALHTLGQLDFPYAAGVLPKFQKPLTAIISAAIAPFAASQHVERSIELMLYLFNPDNVPLYADGLWMPMQKKYYTDPALIEKWAGTKVHPEGYLEAVIDAALNHSVPFPAMEIKNYAQINTAFSAFDTLWQGKESGRDGARKVAQEVVRRVNPLVAGVYPGAI